MLVCDQRFINADLTGLDSLSQNVGFGYRQLPSENFILVFWRFDCVTISISMVESLPLLHLYYFFWIVDFWLFALLEVALLLPSFMFHRLTLAMGSCRSLVFLQKLASLVKIDQLQGFAIFLHWPHLGHLLCPACAPTNLLQCIRISVRLVTIFLTS